MSDMYLTEDDFNFQSSNTELKQKTENIVDFTSSVLLDLSEDDLSAVVYMLDVFGSLQDSLFSNSDTILRSKSLGFTDDERKKLDELQIILLHKWKVFGFTDSFFHRLYQVQRQLKSDDLDDIKNERLDLLFKILNEQKKLVIAFNVMNGKDNPVILDVADYM